MILKDMQIVTHSNTMKTKLCLHIVSHMQTSLDSIRWPDDTFDQTSKLLEKISALGRWLKQSINQ